MPPEPPAHGALHPPAARVLEVVEVLHVIGAGTPGDPCRRVAAYYTRDGDLLATRDTWADEQ